MNSTNTLVRRLSRKRPIPIRRKPLSFIMPVIENDQIFYRGPVRYENTNKKNEWSAIVNKVDNFPRKLLERNFTERRNIWRRMTCAGDRWQSHCKQFCKTTSLHGFNFFIHNENPIVERIFWFVALILVYGCCGYLIKNSVQNWVSSQVVLSMENSPTTVASVPFPAITVCNTNQIKSTVFNISAYLELKEQPNFAINHSYLNQIDYANMFCNRDLDHEWNTDTMDLSIFHEMINVMTAHEKCQEIFAAIKWLNETFLNPCELMQPMLTDVGMCFTFNMLPFKVLLNSFYFEVLRLQLVASHPSSWSTVETTDWTPEPGYYKAIGAVDIPRRTSGAGIYHAFTALMNLNYENYDSSCNSGTQGYTILIHSPADFPSSTNVVLAIGANSSQAITVQPKVLRTSQEIKSWNPADRGCYFDDERHLYYFKLYTQINCNLECESNYSLQQCGCVAYYHPRSLFTPVCGSVKMDCIEDSFVRLAELNANANRKCSCLPSCTTLQYESTDRTVSYIARPSLDSHVANENGTNSSTLDVYSNDSSIGSQSKIECLFTVYYRDRDTLGMVRVGLLTFSDFLGNIGGILGLFLGFSWISLLEIVHFLVVRPFLNSK